MKKLLIVCDHYPLSPRVLKMEKSLKSFYGNVEIKIFAWNRNKLDVSKSNVVSFDQEIGYKSSLAKLRHTPNFIRELKLYIENFKPDVIHTIDFEMMLSSVLINGDFKLVYEIYDIKFKDFRPFRLLTDFIEKTVAKRKLSGIIYASPFFPKYYSSINLFCKSIVINNKPSNVLEENLDSGILKDYKGKLDDKITISFIGKVRHKEILIRLINEAMNFDKFKIIIAGDGPANKEIEDYIRENNFSERVILLGKFNEKDLATIYKFTDYVWAAYPNKYLNVKFAVSNKYFESLLFSKPIIVSEDTELAKVVLSNKFGLTVNPYSKKSIKNTLKQISDERNSLFIYPKRERMYWEDEDSRIKKIYDALLKC